MSNILNKCLALLLAVLFAALAAVSAWAWSGSGKGLMLAVPRKDEDAAMPYERVEELNEEKFLLTYEVSQKSVLQMPQKKWEVTVKATNYTYPYVMGAMPVSGGFFTRQAQEQKQRHAVLNRKAAFDILGGYDIVGQTVKIDGEIFTIVGVIDDGEPEEYNAYVPVTLGGQSPDTFAARPDEDSGISRDYIANVWNGAGINNDRYAVVNLGSYIRVIWRKAAAAVLLLACVLLGRCALAAARRLAGLFKEVKNLYDGLYLKQIIRRHPAKLAGCAGLCAIIAAVAVALACAGLWLLEAWLLWRDYADALNDCSPGGFYGMISLLQKQSLYSDILFAAFASVLVLLMLGHIGGRKAGI